MPFTNRYFDSDFRIFGFFLRGEKQISRCTRSVPGSRSKFQTGTWMRLLESTNFGEFCDSARERFSAVGDPEKSEFLNFRFYDSNRPEF